MDALAGRSCVASGGDEGVVLGLAALSCLPKSGCKGRILAASTNTFRATLCAMQSTAKESASNAGC